MTQSEQPHSLAWKLVFWSWSVILLSNFRVQRRRVLLWRITSVCWRGQHRRERNVDPALSALFFRDGYFCGRTSLTNLNIGVRSWYSGLARSKYFLPSSRRL